MRRDETFSVKITCTILVILLALTCGSVEARQPEGLSKNTLRDAFSLSWLAKDVRENVSSIGMTQKDYYLLTTEPTPITPKPTPLTLPEWTVYNRHNSDLTLDGVQCLEQDDSHRMWLGTSDGVFVYDGTTWQHFNRFNSGITSNFISTITHDRFGRIIIGLKRDFPQPNGISIFEGGVWTSHWLGGDPDTDDRYHNPTSIAVDRGGRIWVATDSRGLWVKDGETWEVYNRANSDIPSDRLSHLVFDDLGRLWIATWEGGYSIYNGFVFQNFSTANTPIPNNRIAWIELTDEETIWFSCAFSGAARLRKGTWSVYPGSDFLYDSFRTIVSDPNLGVHWFATGAGNGTGGARSFDGSEWKTYTTLNSGIPDNNVLDAALDWNNHVWFATEKGVGVYNPSAVENGIVYGTVTDGQSGKPISGAVLTLSGGKHTRSNCYGDYVFVDLAPGTDWVLYGDAEGYLPVREANITVQSDTSTPVNVVLNRASLSSLPANWNEPFGASDSLFISKTGGDLGRTTNIGTYPFQIDKNFGLQVVGSGSWGRLKNAQQAVDSGLLPRTVVLDVSVFGLHHLNEILAVRVNDFLVEPHNIQVVTSRYRWQRIRLFLNIKDNWLYFPREEGTTPAANKVQISLQRPALIDWVSLDLSSATVSGNEDFGALSSPPVEKYFDIDGNWRNELLLMEFQLDTKLSGECFAQARLVGDDNTGVADGQVWLDLKKGTNQIPIYFPGGQISESGRDGPYEFAWVALYTRDASSVYEIDFDTQVYHHDLFEPIGISAEPTPTPPAYTPTPTSHPDFSGDYDIDSIDLFRFGRFWKQPSGRAPILDLHPDAWIDEKDLLAFLKQWHGSVKIPNGDYNEDGVTDDMDFFQFVQAWKHSDVTTKSDVNSDSVVDQKDVLLFLEAWHRNYTRKVGEPVE